MGLGGQLRELMPEFHPADRTVSPGATSRLSALTRLVPLKPLFWLAMVTFFLGVESLLEYGFYVPFTSLPQISSIHEAKIIPIHEV